MAVDLQGIIVEYQEKRVVTGKSLAADEKEAPSKQYIKLAGPSASKEQCGSCQSFCKQSNISTPVPNPSAMLT